MGPPSFAPCPHTADAKKRTKAARIALSISHLPILPSQSDVCSSRDPAKELFRFVGVPVATY